MNKVTSAPGFTPKVSFPVEVRRADEVRFGDRVVTQDWQGAVSVVVVRDVKRVGDDVEFETVRFDDKVVSFSVSEGGGVWTEFEGDR